MSARRIVGRGFGVIGVLAAGALVVFACSEPRIVEDSAAACANDVDDDGDGRTDCADPGCANSGACEQGAAACANDIDDDGDGLVDCEEESCITGGFCEAVPAECDVVARTGCTRGLACSPLSVGGTSFVCARPGVVDENRACTQTADDPAGGCKGPDICYGLGLCTIPCLTDQQCPRSSACIRANPQPYGICSLTCFPATGCVTGYACIPFQRFGFSFANGGWMHNCLPESRLDGGFVVVGQAEIGEPCADGALAGTAPSTVCADGLLCVPAGDGSKACREVCVGNADGSDGKCATGRCVVIDPYDTRPPRPTEPYRVGVCLP